MSEERTANMTERVLGAIESSGAEPRSRWYFLLHEWVVWFVAGLCLMLGSVATALTIYIAQASLFIERQLSLSDIGLFVSLLPYLWLLLLGAGLIYGLHAYRKTAHGYRAQSGWVVGLSIVLSVFVGSTLHAAGVGATIDRYLLNQVPLYGPMSGYYPEHWQAPHEGVAVGVVDVVEQDHLVLQGLDGRVIDVVLEQETVVGEHVLLEPGASVRVYGSTTDGEVIYVEAEDIRPFRGRGGAGRGMAGGRGSGEGMGACGRGSGGGR